MDNRAEGCGNGMIGQPAEIAKQIRNLMNEGRIAELNRLLSDDFFAVCSLGKSGAFETYDAVQYRQGNRWLLEIDTTVHGKVRPQDATGLTSDNILHDCSHSDENTGTLHHVEINVSNLHRSSEFWGWLLKYLGFEPYQNWTDGRSWRKDDTYLVLVQTERDYLAAGYHRKGTGLNHVAFHAGSRKQVDELTESLWERGVPILYGDRHPHAGGPDHYAVFFEDPDRIKLEVVAP